MAFTITGGFTFAAGNTVTPDRLNQIASGLALNFDGTDRLLGRASPGAGVWEEVPCTSFGRGLLAASGAPAAGPTLGLNPGVKWHGTANGLTLADGGAPVQAFIGQDASHALVFQWTYNPTPGSGFGLIGTYGATNGIIYQAQYHRFDTATAAVLQILNNGHVIAGGIADDGTNFLQTTTFHATGNSAIDGNLAVGGSFTVGGFPLASMAFQAAGSVGITGGAINGTPIGATTPSTVKATHLIGGGGAPTIANGAQLGGSGAATAIAGTDAAGVITVTVGSGPGTLGSFADVTFATPYATPPRVLVFPANQIATNLTQYFYTTATTNGWSFNVGPYTISFSGAAWNYIVLG